MRINIDLDKTQKAILYDRLKEMVKTIVVKEDDTIHYGDYLRLVEELEYEEARDSI